MVTTAGNEDRWRVGDRLGTAISMAAMTYAFRSNGMGEEIRTGPFSRS